jgi:electron transport complex protein RnfC|nr:electron transport complex subunit RsxC [Halomonas sp. UBA3074]|tara:strand:+ start:4120 stop:5778 length:1659 start_codon:yes stop_codon:yes gene_type:complete
MSSAFDFPGGIYPPERKQRSNQAALVSAPLPMRVTLPLQQHSGQASTPCVAVGEQVYVGSIIARREGMISSNLHASISGVIAAVSASHIIIEGDGQDTWQRLPSLDWPHSAPAELLERLNESGIVGLGGAGFPTSVKARVVEQHVIHTLVINAAECEPYITADDLTLRHHPTEVLEGAQILAKLCGAQQILIGIEDNKPEAIKALNKALPNSQPVPVALKVVATRYPSGGERQLIKRLLNLNVPSGGLPADVGVLCHNPGTLLAALQAVRDGQPLVSRVVTLTGEALTQPGNRWVRLGTSVKELLTQAGLDQTSVAQVIQGGPMMGTPLLTLDTPVTKLTNCLIAATIAELPPAPAESPCIRCGECESVCPVALLPQQLHWYARAKDDAKMERYHLFDCIECGACSYVCPSHIPLVEDYREAKGRIRLQRIESVKAEHAKHRFEFRQARLAREEAEKQARREARQAQNRRPHSHASTENSEKVDLRGLRIAHAAAKASVKKAEKTLARVAQEDPKQPLDDLEMQLATAQENLRATELQLAQAREQQPSKESS